MFFYVGVGKLVRWKGCSLTHSLDSTQMQIDFLDHEKIQVFVVYLVDDAKLW